MAFKKVLWKYFFFFFFLFFLLFNWNKISWIFYPSSFTRGIKYLLFYKKQISQPPTSSSFTSSPLTSFPSSSEDHINKKTQNGEEETLSSNKQWTGKENSVEMPTIGIFVPLIVVGQEKEINSALDRGAVLHPSSVSPGEKGKTIILGHSTMHRWPKNIAVWAFTYLPDLKEGDEILVNFNHLQYKYRLEKKYIVKEGEDLPSIPEKENHLFLITCWPPGRLSFKQRYVAQAKLIE